MDLGSVIGSVIMWVMIVGAMVLGVGISPYIDAQSGMIVIGGSLGAAMYAYKMEQFKLFLSLLGKSFKPETFNIPEIITKLVEYAQKARRDGILALENDVNNEPNEFLRKGLSMAVDGNEPDVIKTLLELDVSKMAQRHQDNFQMLDNWGSAAGAFGMAGTLVGLVAMLVNMNDPSSIGPAMAVALITTLYGSMIGTMIATPASSILAIRSMDEQNMKRLIVEGIMSIQAGDNPRTLEAKLMAYLPPKQRTTQFE
ncbi:MAG: motility protein A [Helicobacteraceae bacterium]